MKPSQDAVRALARRICLDQGHDPDTPVTGSVAYQFSTPMGPVYGVQGDAFPLWRTWRGVAEAALEMAGADKEMVAA